MAPRRLMTADEMELTLKRMAHQILELAAGGIDLALVGIHSRGAPLAVRLADEIAASGAERPPVGMLDVNLYRDDLARSPAPPVRRTALPFKVDQRSIVLVDDVLQTGRTARAALDALSDLGRPRLVRLAAFIDRGGRELPIHPDITGRRIECHASEVVEVRLAEVDRGRDEVLLMRPETEPPSRPKRPPVSRSAKPTRQKKGQRRGSSR